MGIFTRCAFDFNNKEIIINLPDNAADVDGIDGLDPNDLARIRIERDCKICTLNFMKIVCQIYSSLISLIIIINLQGSSCKLYLIPQ